MVWFDIICMYTLILVSIVSLSVVQTGFPSPDSISPQPSGYSTLPGRG